jgi:hypothetical protein
VPAPPGGARSGLEGHHRPGDPRAPGHSFSARRRRLPALAAHGRCGVPPLPRPATAWPGLVLPWVVCEAVVEDADENDLVNALEEFECLEGIKKPGAACAICDVSSDWQGADRASRNTSWDTLRRRGWRHLFRPDRVQKCNPPILERVKVANALLRSQDSTARLGVHPRRGAVAEAFREYPNTRYGTPPRRSKFAHVVDAATYPLFRLFSPRAALARSEVRRDPHPTTTRGKEFEGFAGPPIGAKSRAGRTSAGGGVGGARGDGDGRGPSWREPRAGAPRAAWLEGDRSVLPRPRNHCCVQAGAPVHLSLQSLILSITCTRLRNEDHSGHRSCFPPPDPDVQPWYSQGKVLPRCVMGSLHKSDTPKPKVLDRFLALYLLDRLRRAGRPMGLLQVHKLGFLTESKTPRQQNSWVIGGSGRPPRL